MSEPQKKFYLTTPIYYVNARPHIGHAYTTIAADVIARRHRLLGDDTFLLTGTDEHGQKIERSAAAAGIPPQQFADQVSASFKALWDRMGITYNDYIRTTDPRHKAGAQSLFTELYDRGHIYLSTYTGAYCVSDETFVDAPVGTPCPDCGRILEEVTEENFFFRLSAFQQHLIDLIESDTLAIQPDVRRNEVLSFLRGNVMSELGPHLSTANQHLRELNLWEDGENASIEEAINHLKSVKGGRLGKAILSRAGNFYVEGALKDLSISRSSFKWGIPVPAEVQQKAGATQPHIIYVWLDALTNYMSAIGYGSEDPAKQEQFKKYWPADLHLVGKEIIRFHCVYWPAFLMGLNSHWETDTSGDTQKGKLVLGPDATALVPKAITAHGWLLFEESKMSKSRGNIVRTETILDAFGNQVYASVFPNISHAEQDLFASDVLRYFLLREIPFGQDGSFSFDALIRRYNSDLANGYGNLVSRTLSMITKYFGSQIPEISNRENIFSDIFDADLEIAKLFAEYDFTSVLGKVWSYISIADGFITERAPWKLAASDDQNDQESLAFVLYTAAESIRIVTALLYPILPYATSRVWTQLGLGDIKLAAKNGDLKNLQWGGLKPGTKLGPLSPIFPRAPKELIQLMTDMETPATPSNLTGETTASAKADPTDTTDPGAPPRTTDLNEPNPAAQVAASAAITTERPATPPSPQSVPSAEPAVESSPTITIDDFVKIDLRVAKILVAERIPKADKLLRLEVDLGYETRQILSGIAEWYTPEELIGRKIIIIANLAPRKMRGLESHGMLLAASHGENGKPILATFGEDIAPGSRLK